MKENVFWERGFFENPCFPAEGIFKLASKLSPSHQRAAVHRNSPQNRSQRVKKTLQVQIPAKYDLRRNRLLGINVSRYTEIVPKNVLSGSKNPQVQSKPSYKLWLPSKSSPGHQRVEAHRNSPENVLGGSKDPQVHSKLSYKLWFAKKLLLGISVSTEIVPKNVLIGSKNPQVQSKPSNRLWFRTKSSPGHQRVEVHWISPQKRTQRVKKAPSYTQICATDYDLRQNLLLGISVTRYTEIVLQKGLGGSKNPRVHSYLWRSYQFYRYIFYTSGLRVNAFYERTPR